MQSVPIDVCCLKVGEKYNHEYVNNLFKQVEKTTLINDFICYTDDMSLIDSNITTKPFDVKYKDRMWWNKVLLFKPDLHERKTIYLDLDTIVHNDLNKLEGQICKTVWFNDLISNAVHGSNLNSSVLIFDNTVKHNWWTAAWKDWLAYSEKIFKSYYGLDMWLFRRHKAIQSNLIIKGIYSFKFTGEQLREDNIVCIFDDYEERDQYLRKFWYDTSK